MDTLKNILFSVLALPASAFADDSFSVVLPECTARLERRSSEPEVVLARSDCPLSQSSLARLLETGLRGLFPAHNLPIRGIYLGRLMDYPEWSKALAIAAVHASTWNSQRGRPRKAGEHDNHVVHLLLNGPAYPQALQAVFAQYGLTACIADVEKVLVFKAKEVFTAAELAHIVPAEARLPVDAQIWLSLQPLSTRCDGH